MKQADNPLPPRSPQLADEPINHKSAFDRRLAKYGDRILWDQVRKAYPCLDADDLTSRKCRTCPWPCKDKNPMRVIAHLLENEELRAKPGGHYADRLLTALSLGVSLMAIENSHLVNHRVALEVLGRTREWLQREAR